MSVRRAWRIGRRWWVAVGALAAATAVPSLAWAKGPGEAAAGLLGLLAVIVLLVFMGLAVGSFGLTVNHVFRRRSARTFQVMCARPGWSLLAGCVVTLLGLVLLALLGGAPPLQLLVLLAYLVGLALFGIAAAVRFAGRILDPTTLDDELPAARLLLKGGLLLLAVNAVPIIGTLLSAGIVLCAVGATLLGYFARPGAGLQPAAAGAPATPAVPTAPAGEPAAAADRASPDRS